MSINKTWNGVVYSIPNTRSESGWETTLSNYLQALADHAATTTFLKQAVRKATTTPVTVSASTDCTIIVDLTGPGASTVNLPAGADKQIFIIVDGKGDASTNNITIDANGSETIEGSLTKVIRLNRECLVLQYSSSAGEWKVIGGYVPNMVGGPASSTDNAIARFDGTTGKLVQNSGATIDDSNNISAASYTATGGTAANNTMYVASNVLRLRGGTSGLGFNNSSGTEVASVTDAGAVTLGPSSFSGVHNINGIVRVVVPGAATGGLRLAGASSESHLQFLGANPSTNGSLRFYSYRSDLSNELDVGFISGSGAWTLGNTGFGSATQQTIYGYGVSGANAVVLRNIATTSGGDIIDIQTAATSGTVSAFTMTDGAGTLCGYCTIDTTANTVSYTNTSDGRLKHLFEDFNGLELIAQMQPWKYERKVQPGKKEIGFVAQEMKLVFPQAVTVGTDELQTMGIDYSKFTPVLVKALQEQQAIIDGLKARVEALESGN